MRINEIEQLNEAPMGLMSRLGKKLQSYIPGTTGATAQAHLDVGNRANEIEKLLQPYIVRIGQNLQNVPASTIDTFLKLQKLPNIKHTQQSYNLKDQNTAKNLFYNIAQQSYSQAGMQGTTPIGSTYGTKNTPVKQKAPTTPTAPTTPSQQPSNKRGQPTLNLPTQSQNLDFPTLYQELKSKTLSQQQVAILKNLIATKSSQANTGTNP